MGLLTFFPNTSSDTHPPPSQTPPKPSKQSNPKPHHPLQTPIRSHPSSWNHFKNLLSCKQTNPHPHVFDPSKKPAPLNPGSGSGSGSGSSNLGRSICGFSDVVRGNTARVVHRADNSPESSSLGQDPARILTRKPAHGSSSTRSLASSVRSSGTCRSFSSTATNATTSSRGIQLRKLSGCYECRMIVDPSRYPIAPRSTVCACTQCGEIFPKMESLEHHQAVRHAVSELGPEDSGRNIVEIIFKSSWMKKDNPVCKIERILKVHNSPRTLQRFEDCRNAVKSHATVNGVKKNPRCAADGNELLRFHCTSLACSLGSRGSSSLCSSHPACGVCTIIRQGFEESKGVKTTASSGRAHDTLECSDGRRAMLVCRVIAGKIRRGPTNESMASPEGENSSTSAISYDSMAGSAGGVYSNLEDLEVFNPRAILPCFVVIYKTLNIN